MADPRTIRLAGSGTDTQQYELAPGIAQYVQSVYVEVDNTAGAAARPVLTLSEQSGVVIAKKRQGESIPAGGTGTATWALRGTDEGGGITEVESTDSSVTVTNPTGPIVDLSVATGGDYRFVQEVAPTGGGTQFSFPSIPQDARHLVIYLNAGGAAMTLYINGDLGANYTYLTDTLQDNAGVVTDVQASVPGASGILLNVLATDGAAGRAVITIPYYRRRAVGAESGGPIDRSLEIEAWLSWQNPVTPVSIYRHAKIAGFWADPAFTSKGAHAITSLLLNAGAGIDGRASLYKVM